MSAVEKVPELTDAQCLNIFECVEAFAKLKIGWAPGARESLVRAAIAGTLGGPTMMKTLQEKHDG